MEPDREVLQVRMAEEQSQGQLCYASLKGGENGGCGENLRTPPNLSTVATICAKVHIRLAVLVTLSSAQ